MYEKLLTISAATVDRMLIPQRAKRKLKGNTHTKPSSILKSQIPILTSSELNTEEPGHYQIDLVGHDGGNPNGQFAHTLDALELSSGWIEPRILINKAHKWAKEAIRSIKTTSPMPILSFHSDNDSAFINENLPGWCAVHEIPNARRRPYHSNDTCYVEQKNYDIVRQAVRYHRHETEEEVALIAELYENLRLLINFFYPSMKLREKKRVDGHIQKHYHRAQSPFRRLLANPKVPPAFKLKLRHQKSKLDPFVLKANIARLQERLIECVKRKNMKILYPGPSYPQAKERMEQYLFGST